MSEPKMEYVRDCSNDLNYKYDDYNNYQSWSNKSNGFLSISSIDEYSNIQTQKFKNHRLQKLSSPFQSFGDTELTWDKKSNSNIKNKETNNNFKDDYTENRGKLYKKFNKDNEYINQFPYEFLK